MNRPTRPTRPAASPPPARRRRRCPALLVGLALVCLTAAEAPAKNSFLVAPGRVDIDLSRPHTQSFMIINNGDGPIRLSIEPIYFEVDSKSLAAGIPLRPEDAGHDDLSGFTRVRPRVLSLKPGQRRDIRISVRPPADLPAGDYRTHLLVRMMETAATFGGEARTEDDRSISMKLEIKMETAVAVYGHNGRREGRLVFGCGADEDGSLLVTVTNATPWRYEGWVRGYPVAAPEDVAPLFEFPFNSLRETRRTLDTRWQPPPGPLELRWSPSKTAGIPGQAPCDPKP